MHNKLQKSKNRAIKMNIFDFLGFRYENMKDSNINFLLKWKSQ